MENSKLVVISYVSTSTPQAYEMGADGAGCEVDIQKLFDDGWGITKQYDFTTANGGQGYSSFATMFLFKK